MPPDERAAPDSTRTPLEPRDRVATVADDPALLLARARAAGPRLVPADLPVPDGATKAQDGETAWLLQVGPDGATPGLLDEYEVERVPVERAGETRRALAAALRCCWHPLSDPPWPGVPSRLEQVTAVFAELSRGDRTLLPRWGRGALRRLRDSSWLLLDEKQGTVRLGPRVTLWAGVSEESLTPLRELVRRLPEPPDPPTQDEEPT